MKSVVTLRIGDDEIAANSLNLSLSLSGCGLGFVTALTEQDCIGKLVRLDLGYNASIYRWLTGFVERSAPAENGSQRLFVRELVGVFERSWPCSLQHPTLRDVTDAVGKATDMRFVLPENTAYTNTPIPHFQHNGSGYQLLDNLGRAFSIPDYVWYQLPDGTVYVGSYADSRFAQTPVDIPQEFAQGGGGGNSLTLPLIPAIRPGVIVNGRRITKVDVTDDKMTLTWTPLNAQGQPAQKSPEQRQIEKIYPELGAGLHLPRRARVMSPTDAAELGDPSDPFRPRYAVNVQLLDENGNAAGTQEYNAVPLPIPMAGSEGGMFQFPPEGTLVEIGFADGRPDKPMIRQILSEGLSLPAVKPGEQLQQQRAGVSQRVTVDGSWQRDTDQAIEETSSRRSVTSDEENRTTTTRNTTVKANDSTTVLGTKTLMAGQVIQLAEGDYSIGTSANMVIKVGKDRNDDVGQNQNTKVGQNLTTDVAGALTEKIIGIRRSVAAAQELIAPKVRLGTDTINVLTLLTDTLDVLQTLANQTASHTHQNTGAPQQAGDFTATATRTKTLATKYGPLIA
ncbi:hypothetical protein RF656_00490 [Yersinia kristensenii]|uniref:hypothetical protein n=1 Tax=Yersinia kristensenii TaxID=28152 RepID=UPI002852FBE2|nr:hypothetical protein [Yersinia kristensenii]MDR4895228.1 hypothetical protein [Yersinia kristensenii]MDX6737844.1 hypothetical protein [Yersinia kristensenii]